MKLIYYKKNKSHLNLINYPRINICMSSTVQCTYTIYKYSRCFDLDAFKRNTGKQVGTDQN